MKRMVRETIEGSVIRIEYDDGTWDVYSIDDGNYIWGTEGWLYHPKRHHCGHNDDDMIDIADMEDTHEQRR